MYLKMAKRLLVETDKRLLGRLVWNAGIKGIRSVQKHKHRLKRGEFFPPFLYISIINSCNLRCQGCWVDVAAKQQQVMDEAERLIRINEPDFVLDEVAWDDRATFELFGRGETIGVFQFESGGMREYLSKLEPDTLEDIIAMNALYRPGPMENIPSFIARKLGKEEVRYPHPKLESILEPTYGIMSTRSR